MLRHNRAATYEANRKYKERDRIHGNHSLSVNPNPYSKPYYEQTEEDYLRRLHKFNLREYLRKAWDIVF